LIAVPAHQTDMLLQFGARGRGITPALAAAGNSTRI
jgi:hypothetical protein